MSSERFLEALQSVDSLCDDCIYRPAGLSRRQGANQLGRRLQELVLIHRAEGTCARCGARKIVKRLADGSNFTSTDHAPTTSPGLRPGPPWHLTPAQFERCVREFVDGSDASNGRQPDDRYASFDYCFNYFQSFRDAGTTAQLSSSEHIQASCLQLGFYLASWGMLRGSSHLLQKSARFLSPVVDLISKSDVEFWTIDAQCYDRVTIRRVLDMGANIARAIGSDSDTLVTKVMLGVFGCVPAFDQYFKRGFGVSTFGPKALEKVAAFYQQHPELVDGWRIPTVDFVTGEPTNRTYTRAKVIDMAFFVRGMS